MQNRIVETNFLNTHEPLVPSTVAQPQSRDTRQLLSNFILMLHLFSVISFVNRVRKWFCQCVIDPPKPGRGLWRGSLAWQRRSRTPL